MNGPVGKGGSAIMTVSMSQQLYIQDAMTRFAGDWQASKGRCATPCSGTIKDLSKGAPDSTETPEVIEEYRSLVGALLWVANVSRPDIAYTVSTLAKFTSCPEKAHLKAARRVLSYLDRTSHYKLIFGDFTGKTMCNGIIKVPGQLVSFTDSSWGDEKPPSGFANYYKGSLVAWGSKRLKTTPLSSCESEYAAATNAANNVVFLEELLEDITERNVRDNIV